MGTFSAEFPNCAPLPFWDIGFSAYLDCQSCWCFSLLPCRCSTGEHQYFCAAWWTWCSTLPLFITAGPQRRDIYADCLIRCFGLGRESLDMFNGEHTRLTGSPHSPVKGWVIPSGASRQTDTIWQDWCFSCFSKFRSGTFLKLRWAYLHVVYIWLEASDNIIHFELI